MKLVITEVFMNSLARLTPADQSRTLETVRKIKNKDMYKGLREHIVSNNKQSFSSYSVNMDIRLISYSSVETIVLLYVDHHDKAYAWIKDKVFLYDEQRKDFAEIIEVKESTDSSLGKATTYGEKLLKYLTPSGVPEAILTYVQCISNEDELISFISFLSPPLQEILLSSACGIFEADYNVRSSNIFVCSDDDELEKALNYPFDKWRLFLHPLQQNIVNSNHLFKQILIGGPGTGKTITLLHRACHLAGLGLRVLFLTHNETLAESIKFNLSKLDNKGGEVIVCYLPTGWYIADPLRIYGNTLYFTESKDIYRALIIEKKPDDRFTGSPFNHIIVDELHDFVEKQQQWLIDLTHRNDIGLTLAMDNNQMVYPGSLELLSSCLQRDNIFRHTLSYCYRSGKEIIKHAIKKHSDFLSPLSTQESLHANADYRGSAFFREYPRYYPLSGALVTETQCKNKNLQETIESTYRSLTLHYSKDEIQIIGPAELQNKINHLISYQKSKGLEWFAGIVLIDNAKFKTKVGKIDKFVTLKYINGLYVALSRFREKVHVIYFE